jgi:hypothetical protein
MLGVLYSKPEAAVKSRANTWGPRARARERERERPGNIYVRLELQEGLILQNADSSVSWDLGIMLYKYIVPLYARTPISPFYISSQSYSACTGSPSFALQSSQTANHTHGT